MKAVPPYEIAKLFLKVESVIFIEIKSKVQIAPPILISSELIMFDFNI